MTRALNYGSKNISYFTTFHRETKAFFEPQWEMRNSFTDAQISHSIPKFCIKIAGIAGISFGFGALMGMFMSSFEFNSSLGVDTDRSTKSQLKQHFHGYGRFLKKQGLHFARFGLYIGLLEVPLELIVGRLNTPVVFVSGGLAAAL